MIALLAVGMLFVIGAIAAIAIDVVTFYTARSEAQLAADSAALTAARVLANSGLTSTVGPITEEGVATTVAQQVATQDYVGGRALRTSEVTVTYNDTVSSFATDPHVTVTVKRTDLPTFFARILGTTQITVAASATAEAYNPSGANTLLGGPATPVAPLCVKPWLLPNVDPTVVAGSPMFTAATGAIYTNVVGESWPNTSPNGNGSGLYSVCPIGSTCTGSLPGTLPNPAAGRYYPAAMDGPPDFFAPTQALPACDTSFTPYQSAIAGCVQQPISCGVNSSTNPSAFNVDTSDYGNRDGETVVAAECLIHYNGAGDSDSIDGAPPFSPPFQFIEGNQNPVVAAQGQPTMVSDSIVTIPVIDISSLPLTNPVNVIGFLQVFLNPQSSAMPSNNQIPVTIINMAGCGNTATGTPILGNGASPVAVRLITPP